MMHFKLHVVTLLFNVVELTSNESVLESFVSLSKVRSLPSVHFGNSHLLKSCWFTVHNIATAAFTGVIITLTLPMIFVDKHAIFRCVEYYQNFHCLQCFGAVGWVAGRASGL